MNTAFFMPPKPRLFGHRGCDHFPENTIPAFRHALQAGLIYLELDVWSSRNGEIMVHHDRSLARICGIPDDITALTGAEIKKLDAGYCHTNDKGKTFPYRGRGISIPSLAEVLRSLPGVYYVIEIKQESPAIEPLVIETVRRANMQNRVLLASEKDSVVRNIRRLDHRFPTNLAFNEVIAFYNWLAAGRTGNYKPPGEALQIPPVYDGRPLVTPDSVRAAHAVGLEVHVWTVNTPDEIRRLLDLGVDGVMSDRPELLKA